MRSSVVCIVFALAGCGGLYQAEPGACVYNKPHDLPPSPGFAFTVTLPDGSTQSCHDAWSAGSAGNRAPQSGTISGWVSAADATSFAVDTCVSGSGCATETYQFAVEAPALSLALPIGRRVSVSWSIEAYWGCTQSLVVADAASTALWFAGTDGLIDPALPKPFSVATTAVSCSDPSQSDGCGGMLPGDYAFVFTPLSGAPSLTLATGQTGTLALTVDTVQHLTVNNLRSYQTELCDDYGNWAWWAAGHANANGEPE
jgi:hypothetical protein